MGKFIAGIAGAVIAGALLWLITNALFPQWFSTPTPLPVEKVRVECSANPTKVSPGGVTEVTVKVMLGDEPVEGATVKLKAGGGMFNSGTTTTSGYTYSGGIFRTTWTAPLPSAGSYVFPADVDLKGVRTQKAELEGQFRTNCEILVSSP
jgi:hypothetical protein